ncbi:DinB family protein [Flavobacterium sp. 3HN19-14]|uniref:DinB family protein n=1 Tax=Flavobacterium sp. 3HN19-14 TaxID=3448133 RepID=UPI003EDEE920
MKAATHRPAKEVVAHLIVCENTDWLPRARIMLSDKTDRTLERIDMTADFAIARDNSTETLLTEFKMLRERSITALKGFNLQENDFEKSAFHPLILEVNLRQLIAAWVTHDLSHLAQISRVMAQQYKGEVGTFKEFLKIIK